MPRGRLILIASHFTLALSCWLAAPRSTAQTPTEADETLLRNAGLPTDGPGLLDFFRKRSLKVADRQILEELAKKLDDRSYKVRTDAAKELIVRGRLALPFLKKAAKSGSLEMV